MNKKRQNSQVRNGIVDQYLKSIKDDKERMVCFLLMRRSTEEEICKAIKITPKELECIKLQIAIGLRQAGIRI